MALSKDFLKRCIESFLSSGEEIFVPAPDEKSLASLRVRLYKIRGEIKLTDPDIEEKLDIVQQTIKIEGSSNGMLGISLSKPSKVIVFKSNGAGGFVPFNLPSGELKSKLIKMKRDGLNEKEIFKLISKEERKEALEIWAMIST